MTVNVGCSVLPVVAHFSKPESRVSVPVLAAASLSYRVVAYNRGRGPPQKDARHCHAAVNLEIACDVVPQELAWWCLGQSGVVVPRTEWSASGA